MSCRSRYTDWTSGEPVEREWMMSEPRTEAGRRLLGWMRLIASGESAPPFATAQPAILAIEAEARASVLAEVREGVEGLPFANDINWAKDEPVRQFLDRAAVLALLDTLSDGGPTDG